MANMITMPKLGLTMTEGTVLWKKQVGDRVQIGDVVFEVETDKLTNEVESPFDGVLLLQLCPEGGEISCTERVAVIGEAGECVETEESNDRQKEIQKEMRKEDVLAEESDRHVSVKTGIVGYYIASPIAKKIAKENGLLLADIAGTGPNGRVIEKDVLAYLENAGAKIKASPVAKKMAYELGVSLESINMTDKTGRVMKEDVCQAVAQNTSNADMKDEKNEVKLNKMRQTISKRMSESWSTSPRVCYNMSIDCTELKECKNKLAPTFLERGVKLTFNHILMKVCAKALEEIPDINGSLCENTLTLHQHVNIGMAVGMESGLIVPNVKACEEKSLLAIAQETEAVIKKARNNKLEMKDMTGGTFTITNLGMYGIETFSPIINQPELAILGVNAMIDTPVVIDGTIVIRPIMALSLVADHRVVDGLKAAQCLKKIKTYLENPYLLLV